MKKGTIVGLSIGAGVVALAAVAAGFILYTVKSLDGLRFDDITMDYGCDCNGCCDKD